MNGHAILPPSSAEQWVNCPGWVQMSIWYPEDEESEAARIGTAVHELGAFLIEMDVAPCGDIVESNRSVGDTASNGVLYTQEMVECAELYAGYCWELFDRYPNAEYNIEQHVSIGYVHSENSGTPDFVLVDQEAHVIHIVDYKHGRGLVEAFENWQLLDYLVGVMHKYGVTEDTNPPKWSCHLTIVQPRGFHPQGVIRTWSLSSDQVRPYATRLKNAAIEALSGSPLCHAGEHCRYCVALHACSTALQTGMLLFDVAGRATPMEMSPQAMALQYKIIKSAQKLLSALEGSYEAQLVSKIRSGENIPGWKLEGSIGNLEWMIPKDEVAALGDLMGVDLRKAPDVITPAQARDKGFDVNEYASRPNKGFKLVEFDSYSAARLFNVQGGQNNGSN